jgi:hypothetical protein
MPKYQYSFFLLEIVLHAWLACLRMVDVIKLFHLDISMKLVDWGMIYRATVIICWWIFLSIVAATSRI